MIREKRIKSGRLLEADFYPVYDSGKRMNERAVNERPTSEQMKAYNKKQSEKKFIRFVNCNFDEDDIFLHLTCSPENAPQDEEAMRRYVNNYLRRIDYYREKNKLSKLKYIYVLESKTYRSGKYAGLVNWHCHLFMTGKGLSRDEAEKKWNLGTANANRYQPDTFGPETAARYLSKDPKGKKRFVCSKNLKKPIEGKPRDGKVGRKTVERMAKLHIDDKEYWERRYKGYEFISCSANYNEYNGHWYVNVVMFKFKKQQVKKRS